MILFGTSIAVLAIANLGHASSFSSGQINVSTIASLSGGIRISSGVSFLTSQALLVSGSSGSIVTSSSITANSFFGDGSRMGGIAGAGLWDDQVFSGANSFLSSFTVRSGGRGISLSTASAAGNIQLSSAGVLTFSPELHVSTWTQVPDSTTSNTACGPCVNGSTLTLATTGGRVEIVFTGSGQKTFGTYAMLTFLQDGEYIVDLGSRTSVSKVSSSAASSEMSFSYIATPPAGVHNYCLSLCALGGGGAARVYNDSLRGNLFYVKELK